MELSDGTAHTITDAYAGKEYIIQVAAKDNEIGTWSDWSVAAHATPWTEEPRHLTTEAQAPGEPACPLPCPVHTPTLQLLPKHSLRRILPVCHRPTHLPNTCVPGSCSLDVLGGSYWMQWSLMRLGKQDGWKSRDSVPQETPALGGTQSWPCPEFPPCSPETTTSTTNSLAPPPTTKICDPGELGSGGGPSIPFLTGVPVTLALAAAAVTANNLLIW